MACNSQRKACLSEILPVSTGIEPGELDPGDTLPTAAAGEDDAKVGAEVAGRRGNGEDPETRPDSAIGRATRKSRMDDLHSFWRTSSRSFMGGKVYASMFAQSNENALARGSRQGLTNWGR